MDLLSDKQTIIRIIKYPLEGHLLNKKRKKKNMLKGENHLNV